MSKPDVLLPEQEWVSVRVVEDSLSAKLVTDGPHTLNGLHKVTRLTKTIEVEGKLGELQRLCRRDCRRKQSVIKITLTLLQSINISSTKVIHLLRRFSPVVSYLS